MATYYVTGYQDALDKYNQIETNKDKLASSVETAVCDLIDKKYFKYLELMRDVIMQEVDKGLSPNALTIQGDALINQKAAKIIQDIEDSMERNKSIKEEIREEAGKYEIIHLQALVKAIDEKIADLLYYNPTETEQNIADQLTELKPIIQERISLINH